MQAFSENYSIDAADPGLRTGSLPPLSGVSTMDQGANHKSKFVTKAGSGQVRSAFIVKAPEQFALTLTP